MSKLFNLVLKHKIIVIAFCAVAVVLSIVGMMKTVINPDISSYLTNDTVSKKTMNTLSEYFDVHGDASIVVEGEAGDYMALKELAESLSGLEDVKSVLWLGSYDALFDFSEGQIVSANPIIPDENLQKLTTAYYKEADGKTYWLFNLALSVANSGGAASEVLDNINAFMSDYSVSNGGSDYIVGGNSVQSQNMLDSALGELPLFLGVAVVIIAIILLLTSKSVVSAFIFLVTIGVSILFNMGTNFFADSVSTVTFSVAAILQLALSMDYSIFLTHAYERERAKGGQSDEASMTAAVKKTLVVIAASALTTVAGFIALFAMKFKMGFDLGLCLAKGVSFSFLTVVFLQPCLMLFFQKACDKTAHKAFEPKLESLARLPKKSRYFLPAICALLIVPTLLMAINLNYYYMDSNFSENAVGVEKVSQELGTQTVFIVPRVSDEKQLELLTAVESEPMVTGIIGYYSFVSTLTNGISIPIYASLDVLNAQTLLFNIDLTPSDVLSLAAGGSLDEKINGILSQVPVELQGVVTAQLSALSAQTGQFSAMLEAATDGFFAEIDGTEYTYFAVTISGEPESEEALETVNGISASAESILGAPKRLAAGNTQAVFDLKATTERDFIVVSVLSALLILIILIITFRGILVPLLLVALIELAILMNISVTAVMGNELNFMSYIVISAIQMGATIDYAILFTQNYKSGRKTLNQLEAASAAVKASAFPILLSASILVCACLSVYFVSSDRIIREITMLIARGAAISAALVLTTLPAIFSIRLRRKKKA